MSKYTQKPYSAEEKRKAVEQFAEKITYSPRYASEFEHLFLLYSTWDVQAFGSRAIRPSRVLQINYLLIGFSADKSDEDYEYR